MARISGQEKESASATQTFGLLTIDKRVLTTPSRTIAIRNIATVSVGTHVEPRAFILVIMAIMFAVLAIGAFNVSNPFSNAPNIAGWVLAVLSLVFVLIYFRPEDRTHYLLISTCDGVLSRFTGPQRETLNEVRDLITAKINAADDVSSYTINFEKGTIENLSVASAGSISTATHVSGTGNTVAAGGATAVSGYGNTVQTANGANGRVATSESSYAASRSPGAQLGNGNSQNGAHHANHETAIDFSHYLPAVVDMHRFYARQPDAQHLEQRLHELELLMRAGAAGRHQKTRIRELSGELSQILQAYPAVTQIFQHIAGLAM